MNIGRDFAFRALDGSSLLGYLAALGLMSVLERDDPELRAKWVIDEAGPYPVVQLSKGATSRHIIDRLYGARGWWRERLAALPDATREAFASLNFNAVTYREFAQASLGDPDRSALAAFAGAENSRLSRKGERRFVRSPYYFFSGQQDLTATILEIAEHVFRQELETLFDCVPSGVPLRKKVMCLRFEPQEVEDHALRMVDPSADRPPTNVPINFLAAFALPLLCSWPSEWGTEALNNKSVRGGDRLLRWRLWDEWLSLRTSLSMQRAISAIPAAQGVLFSAKAVLAVRGQTYYRMLPSRRER